MKLSFVFLFWLSTSNIHSSWAFTDNAKKEKSGIRVKKADAHAVVDDEKSDADFIRKLADRTQNNSPIAAGIRGIGELLASLNSFLISLVTFNTCVNGETKKVFFLRYLISLVRGTAGACPPTTCAQGFMLQKTRIVYVPLAKPRYKLGESQRAWFQENFNKATPSPLQVAAGPTCAPKAGLQLP
jgi:hypothetical protein